ncbi:acyl-CoA N-acyltransferase [Aureobasidium pullulans]|uniref:Glucosamine 6-phosphate N-acetyltransferase n=1 Tax=Aureobasidium pullulans TaxID=5580 RepID=A0A4S9XPE0_AURPU|nr:acyl-CoA N-acyltransferase [Aureobasidium pullulans]
MRYTGKAKTTLSKAPPRSPLDGRQIHTMSSESLFSPDLISSEVAAALPEGYTIRPLQKSDYHAGFLDVLAVLTTVGDVSEQDFNERFQEMQASGALGKGAGGYHTLVILNGENKIVGTGALIVEKKFLGQVGHIEDIAVAKDQQGKKLGLRIIQALDHVAEKVGCYKTILDCSEANEGFYVKCGFKRAGLEMAHYYNKP